MHVWYVFSACCFVFMMISESDLNLLSGLHFLALAVEGNDEDSVSRYMVSCIYMVSCAYLISHWQIGFRSAVNFCGPCQDLEAVRQYDMVYLTRTWIYIYDGWRFWVKPKEVNFTSPCLCGSITYWRAKWTNQSEFFAIM